MRLALLLLLALATTAQAQLLDPDRDAYFRSLIPPVADVELQKIFQDEHLIFYTEEDFPAAYQQGGQFVRITNDQNQFIRRGSDGNFREPWARAGGLSSVRNKVTEIRFISLPRDTQGNILPIIYQNGRLDEARDGNNLSKVWYFPIGTVVGEILAQEGPDKKFYVFEIRVRKRERDDWNSEVHRPFPTAESLAEGIKALYPDWESNRQLANAVGKLTQPVALTSRTFDDTSLGDRDRGIFRQTFGLFALPPIAKEVVYELHLEATFELVTKPFFEGTNGVVANAPSNPDYWNIVPIGYRGAELGFTGKSCMECHETAGAAQRRVENTWAGHFRGSDGIFSFRPFNLDGTPVKALADAGLIAEYNQQTQSNFPAEFYSSISKLRHVQ